MIIPYIKGQFTILHINTASSGGQERPPNNDRGAHIFFYSSIKKSTGAYKSPTLIETTSKTPKGYFTK